MRDDRPIDAWQEGGTNDNDASLLEQYVEDYLEYLDGTRPTAPSPDRLTKEERAEARNVIRLFKLHWGTERTPASLTTEETCAQESADPWDVLVWHHTADRGWANWITLELEGAGLRCRPAPFDQVKQAISAAENTQIVAVVSSVTTTCYQAGEPGMPFQQLDTTSRRQLLAVRVEDCQPCEMLEQIPTGWLDLVGSNEAAARTALLQRVTGQAKPGEGLEQEQPSFTPLHALLDKVALHRTCPYVTTHTPSLDAFDGDYETESALAHPTELSHSTDTDDMTLPPMLRATLSDRLGADAKRWAYLAEELLSLARVKLALGSLNQAREVYQQAREVYQQAHVMQKGIDGEQGSISLPSVRWRESGRAPVIRSTRELAPWSIAGCGGCN